MNNKGENMKEKKYIVKAEKELVVSLLKVNDKENDYKYSVVDEVYSKCSSDTYYSIIGLIENYYYNGNVLDIPTEAVYKGVAKCDNFDEFNEKTGKRIAGNKAEMKYHLAMAKKYKKLVEIIGKAYEELYVLECEHANRALNLNHRIEEYTKNSSKNI